MPLQKKKNFIPEYERIARTALRSDLALRKEPAIDRVVFLLSLAKRKGIKEFMEQTHYFIFDWALEHDNIALINALLDNIRNEDHFLMIEYNDYEYIKKFIDRCVKNGYEDDRKSSRIREAILTKIISIDPATVGTILYDYLDSLEKRGCITEGNHKNFLELRQLLDTVKEETLRKGKALQEKADSNRGEKNRSSEEHKALRFAL